MIFKGVSKEVSRGTVGGHCFVEAQFYFSDTKIKSVKVIPLK